MDGLADGIQQSRGATHKVFFLRNRADHSNIDAVVEQFIAVVKQHRSDNTFSAHFPLLFQHRIIPANLIRKRSYVRNRFLLLAEFGETTTTSSKKAYISYFCLRGFIYCFNSQLVLAKQSRQRTSPNDYHLQKSNHCKHQNQYRIIRLY